MTHDYENNQLRAEHARSKVQFEDDTHRAAIEDNPEVATVSFRTWAAIIVRTPFLIWTMICDDLT
jgi:hypothetical protein